LDFPADVAAVKDGFNIFFNGTTVPRSSEPVAFISLTQTPTEVVTTAATTTGKLDAVFFKSIPARAINSTTPTNSTGNTTDTAFASILPAAANVRPLAVGTAGTVLKVVSKENVCVTWSCPQNRCE
jgi:hypothetical protein